VSTSLIIKVVAALLAVVFGPYCLRRMQEAADAPPQIDGDRLVLRPPGVAVGTYVMLSAAGFVGGGILVTCLDPVMPIWFFVAAGAFVVVLFAVGCYAIGLACERVTLDAEELRCRSLLRGWRSMSWDEITRVDFSTYWYRFAISNSAGRTLRVSRWLVGHRALCTQFLERLPDDVLTGEAHCHLD